jgi:hypothetical protein
MTIILGFKEADAHVMDMSGGVEKHLEDRKVQLKDE